MVKETPRPDQSGKAAGAKYRSSPGAGSESVKGPSISCVNCLPLASARSVGSMGVKPKGASGLVREGAWVDTCRFSGR
eukprot:3872770-Rhodomonas_salina.2